MKLQVRYYKKDKDNKGKTYVKVNDKWMSLAKAVLYPSVGKEIYRNREELKEYARKAEELSKIKVKHCTKDIERSYNPYYKSEYATFYINGKKIYRVDDWHADVDRIESPDERYFYEIKEELGISESEIGKIDWVNGTYFANGKPISKEERDFIYAYVNNAEFDTETKRISTAVQPANLLVLGDFDCHGTWLPYEEYKTANIRKLGPDGYYKPHYEEDMRFVSKRNKNLQVIPTKYQIVPAYIYENYGCWTRDFFEVLNTDQRVGTQFDVWYGNDFYGRVHCFNSAAFSFTNRGVEDPNSEKYPFNVEKLWDDKLFVDCEKTDKDCDPIDFVDLEARIILDNYSKAKTKNDELGS